MNYYINRNGEQSGPFSLQEIQQQLAEGRIATTDLAWAEGMPQWVTVADILKPAGSPAPQPAPVRLTKESTPSSAPFNPVAGVKPPNYLVHAILSTLCCCLPFGIVAIVFAAQVDSKYAAGDYAGSEEASKKAKMWFLVALISGLVAGSLWIGLNVIVAFGRASS